MVFVMCGIVIPLGRLKAKPFAKFCTECRTVYEHEFVKRAKKLIERFYPC